MAMKLKHVAVAAAVLLAGTAVAQPMDPPDTLPSEAASTKDNKIFGSELMSVEERQDYETRLNNLRTEAERERFKDQHEAQMRARASARGVTLPEADSRIDVAQGPGTERERSGTDSPGTSRDTGQSDALDQSRDEATDRMRQPTDQERQMRDPNQPAPGQSSPGTSRPDAPSGTWPPQGDGETM